MDHQTNEIDISSLPPEIIVQIFGYLTHRERFLAALTCKEWYQLAFSPRFCKKVLVYINAHNCLSAFQDILLYKNCRNAFVLYDIVPDKNRNAIASFFRTAPLEFLRIVGNRHSIKTFLDDHLPSIKLLTTLYVNTDQATEDILTINHPSLKSIIIVSSSGCENFELSCPRLIALKIALGSEKFIHLVIQPQQQLQCLELASFKNQHFVTLAKTNLNNLKKLHLMSSPDNIGLELSFNQMVNLEELHLNDVCHTVKIGEELGVLKCLSNLTLVKLVIDAQGFSKALRKMVALKDLHLDECMFTSATQSCHIESEHVKNLSLVGKKDSFVMLPLCTKLKSLTLLYNHAEIDGIFAQVCDFYPELEKLNFGVLPGLLGTFLSPTSFPQIKKLKLLKDLQLTRLFLHNVDWSECTNMKIENLKLDGCAIQGTGALQLVEAFGHGLRQLFIDHCYLQHPRADVFDIDENCVEGLRNYLPRCRISYYDCHIESLYGTCGGKRMLPV